MLELTGRVYTPRGDRVRGPRRTARRCGGDYPAVASALSKVIAVPICPDYLWLVTVLSSPFSDVVCAEVFGSSGDLYFPMSLVQHFLEDRW